MVTTEIILHLRADGSTDMDKNPQTIRIELITAKNNTVPLSPETTVVSCRQNPLHIHVTKDLSQPFFLTKGFESTFQCVQHQHFWDQDEVVKVFKPGKHSRMYRQRSVQSEIWEVCSKSVHTADM